MPAPREQPSDPPVRIERHRAERLSDLAVVGGMCCSSCCCCCCCVHAIGGVVGAAVGSAKAVASASKDPEALRGVHVTNIVYWGGFIAVASLLAIVGLASDHFWETMLVVAIGAPFFQIGMSVLVLPIAAAQTARRRPAALATLRDVTIGAVLGAIVGTVVFLGIGAILLAGAAIFS